VVSKRNLKEMILMELGMIGFKKYLCFFKILFFKKFLAYPEKFL